MDRTLIVMRHAKSTWPLGVSDLKRPLSNRGRRDAVVAGQVISSRLPRPQLLIVSPAERARQTLKLVESALGPVPIEMDERLYGASWWDLLDVVRDAREDVATVMLLGHNPGLEDLVRQLAGSGNPEAVRHLGIKFPTSAIAVLCGNGSWRAWGPGSGFLRDLIVPRAD